MSYVKVALPCPVFQCFDYALPEGIGLDQITVGQRVRVQFGHQELVGVVLEIVSALNERELRPLLGLQENAPLLTADLLQLGQWMAQYYQTPIGEVFSQMLPIALRHSMRQAAAKPAALAWQITTAGDEALRNKLCQRSPAKLRLLQALQSSSPQAQRDLRDLNRSAAKLLRQLEEQGWVEQTEIVAPFLPQAPHVLTAAQQQVAQQVIAELGQFQPFLLDGVTGSGKTEVYLTIAQAALKQGLQVLILVPEIGLTPQLLARIQSHLGSHACVLHSGLTAQQRLQSWCQIRADEVPIVIGTRSALFAPLTHLGLIILDEEHDASFKQQDGGMRYSARDTAIVRAQLLNIPVVLGSATPSLETLANALQGRYQWLKLHQRVGSARLPQWQVVNIKGQSLQEGLSAQLIMTMREHLERDEQVLLFLNQRGFAPTLRCNLCGWIAGCPHCEARLTLHHFSRQLVCHHCEYTAPIPARCPQCQSHELKPIGQGTQRIELALEHYFPQYPQVRIDRDSTARRGEFEQMIAEIRNGTRRILIGTQMLAKGHDFPNVTLVGVINTDGALFSGDFRAEERLAQLLVQVSGRAGRADLPGKVLIQTAYPEHRIFSELFQIGYSRYAERLLEERKEAQLPPFAAQALLRAEAPELAQALQFLAQARELLAESGIVMQHPFPAPMPKRANFWRAQLLVEAPSRSELQRAIHSWAERVFQLKKGKVRWNLDIDPNHLF